MSKVSIVIPTYNCAQYITESIKSVLNQTHKASEIIVVNDGSTDNTKEVLSDYVKKNVITYIYQDNKGPASARNRGIKKATGEYIAFLDADDLWERNKLEKSVAFLERGGFDWIATASKKIDMTGNLIKERKAFPGMYGLNPETHELYGLRKRIFSYRYNLPIHVQTFVVKRGCFDKAGLFDESILMHEDTDLVSRFESVGLRGGFLNEMLTIYRYRKSSITKNKKIDTVYQNYCAARKLAREMGLANPSVRKAYSNFLWEAAGRYYVKGKMLSSVKFMALSFLTRGFINK